MLITNNSVISFAFFLVPQYSMIALLSAIEPLRIANRLTGQQLYSWMLVTEDGSSVPASNGMSLLTDMAMNDVDSVSKLIVCSSFNPENYNSKAGFNWLQKFSRKGIVIGALDTGCHILARAGLLDGYQVTMHWEAVPAFKEEFPNIVVLDKLYEIDRNRISCAGGIAALDMILHIIGSIYGRELALSVSEQCINKKIRDESEQQREKLSSRLGTHNAKLLKIVEVMSDNLEHPLSSQELAAYVHVSVRQLERLFKQHLEGTPSGYYLKLRLECSRQLLQQSAMNIMEISIACGFNSPSHFSRAYRSHYGVSPKSDRIILS
jgi:AraC family carnitine catabolism transcriptional activator